MVIKTELLPVRTNDDVVMVRQTTRNWSVEVGFSLVDVTKMVTAASELARNTVIYGGGGTVRFERIEEGGRRALRLVFEDQGPGIPDVNQALKDGFTTGNGLGLGLSGAKRLVSDFEIWSEVGRGTRVSIGRWK